MNKKLIKANLFIKYANPNDEGVSEWMDVKNVADKFKDLVSNNGYPWCQNNSKLNKTYVIEKKYKGIEGHSSLLKVKLNRYRNK